MILFNPFNYVERQKKKKKKKNDKTKLEIFLFSFRYLKVASTILQVISDTQVIIVSCILLLILDIVEDSY